MCVLIHGFWTFKRVFNLGTIQSYVCNALYDVKCAYWRKNIDCLGKHVMHNWINGNICIRLDFSVQLQLSDKSVLTLELSMVRKMEIVMRNALPCDVILWWNEFARKWFLWIFANEIWMCKSPNAAEWFSNLNSYFYWNAYLFILRGVVERTFVMRYGESVFY